MKMSNEKFIIMLINKCKYNYKYFIQIAEQEKKIFCMFYFLFFITFIYIGDESFNNKY